jgi:hypothetical protein
MSKTRKTIREIPKNKSKPAPKKRDWMEEEDKAEAAAKAAAKSNPTPKATAKPVVSKTPAPAGEKQPRKFIWDDVVVKSNPDFTPAPRAGTIAAAFQAAFKKESKVSDGVDAILMSDFSAPRSQVFKDDPKWFIRDHVSYFIQKGLINKV